jgi:hypothetical protein
MAMCLTLLAVLFFKFMAKSTSTKLSWRCFLAMSFTQSGTVAENRQIWMSWLHCSLMMPSICSTSSMKPCFSIWSTSSSTTALMLEKSMLPLWMWSSTLPVVPTKTSTPLLRAEV